MNRKITMKIAVSGAVVFLLLIMILPASAQSWQWAKSGGGSSSATSGAGDRYEKVVDIATDEHGNTYLLCNAYEGGLNIDGVSKTSYGRQDIMVASFTCNGNLRWAKTIGASNNDVPSAIAVDREGHVYVAGNVMPPSGPPQTVASFDTDTTLDYTNMKRIFLVQYDTSGNFQWLRMPQADTVSLHSAVRFNSLDMVCDTSGNVHWLTILDPGQLSGAGSPVISTQGVYMLQYNPSGTLTAAVKMDMGAQAAAPSAFICHMNRDRNSGHYYISGQYQSGPVAIGGQNLTKSMFVAAFNAQGQVLWRRENTEVPYFGVSNSVFYSRPVVDGQGNIFLAGTSQDGDTINGYVVSNVLGGQYTRLPLIMKMDSNGNNIWVRTALVNGATFAGTVGLYGNEVVLAGSYPGKLLWQGEDSLEHGPNQGYDIFLARFNAQTGSLVGLDSIASNFGAHEYASSLAADNKGNLYLGGEFGSQIMVNGGTLTSIGGQTDFFVAKYGSANCNCTIPVSNFSYTLNTTTNIASFSYSGTTAVDSVVWHFGDGSSDTGMSVNHSYTVSGNYQVCVSSYNDCGVDSSCQSISITVGIADVTGLEGVHVYPNPASDYIMIEGRGKMQYSMYSITGQQVSSGSFTERKRVSVEELSAGVYMLMLTDEDGNRGVVRVVVR